MTTQVNGSSCSCIYLGHDRFMQTPGCPDHDRPTPNFENALQTWLAKVQELVNAEYSHRVTSGPGAFVSLPKLEVCEGGKKYIRIARNDGSSRSAYAFIDTTSGDVLKPDGWKRPAKGARGNIFTDNLGVSAYGALYKR